MASAEPVAAGLVLRAADTGRVLLMHRSPGVDEEGGQPGEDPAGPLEFPGGRIEEGELPFAAACREFEEETGRSLPPGRVAEMWHAENGYVGFVYEIAAESLLGTDEETEPEGAHVAAALGWFDPAEAPSLAALRPEARSSPWGMIAGRCCDGRTSAEHRHGSPDGRCCTDVSKGARAQALVAAEAIVAEFAPRIASALGGVLRPHFIELIETAKAEVGTLPSLNKAKGSYWGILFRYVREIIMSAARKLGLNMAPLRKVLLDLYKGAFAAGKRLSNPAAVGGAAELAGLLAQMEASIQGIAGTTLERIGDELADGIAEGETIPQMTKRLDAIIDDPARAELIARTETMRALVRGIFAEMADMGVREWEWETAHDSKVCAVCLHNQADGPYPVGGGPPMPSHPRCRCVPQPVVKVLAPA